MPKQIQGPNVGQALVRQYGLKGRFQPLLDEIIVPVVLVGETLAEELARLVMGSSIAAAPGAGNQTRHFLSNPIGSGVRIHLSRLLFVNPANPDAFEIDLQSGPVSGNVGQVRDSRFGTPKGETATGTIATGVLGAVKIPVAASDSRWVEGPWIIEPGFRIALRQENANEACYCSWMWQEFPLDTTIAG